MTIFCESTGDDINESATCPFQSSNAVHGTEIKIPGVGATPVAVSTQLPAAVVQLSQLGESILGRCRWEYKEAVIWFCCAFVHERVGFLVLLHHFRLTLI